MNAALRDEFIAQFGASRSLYERFTSKLAVLVEELLNSEHIDHEPLESRTKEISHFAEKLSRPGKNYTDPIREITDLSGLRIIVHYTDSVELVSSVIEREFLVDQANSLNKQSEFDVNEFGYLSIHYVLELSNARNQLPEWRDFRVLKAEIQVRTVLQHAWASVSRTFDYTQESDVPSVLRRRLFRLAGLFELADEEFLAIRSAHSAVTQTISEQLSQGNQEIELNADSIREYVSTSNYLLRLHELAKDIGFSFSASVSDYSSQITSIAVAHGLRTIRQLAETIEIPDVDAQNYLGVLLEEAEHRWEISDEFLVLLLLLRAWSNDIEANDLVTIGSWADEIAERVIRAGRQSKKQQPGST